MKSEREIRADYERIKKCAQRSADRVQKLAQKPMDSCIIFTLQREVTELNILIRETRQLERVLEIPMRDLFMASNEAPSVIRVPDDKHTENCYQDDFLQCCKYGEEDVCTARMVELAMRKWERSS